MKTHAAIVLALSLILGTGCSSYRWGETSHPYLKSLSVAPVVNLSEEAKVGEHLRIKLNECLYQATGIHPEDMEHGRALLKAQIVNVKQSVTASVAAKDNEDRSTKYGNVSSTTLYGVEVTVEYEVCRRGSKIPFIPKTSIKGEATVPKLPDMDAARQIGLEAALADAARKIAESVSESW